MSEEEVESDSDAFLRAVARAPSIAPAPPPAPATPLTQLAHFKVEDEIGRGGMGIVYRAVDEKLRRTVALKVLPESFDDDDERRRRFMREARVAASISHANVAQVYEVGEIDGRIFIAMELVHGSTLRRRLDRERLTIPEALRIVREVARGLARAHDRGVAHRDLKPDNVMVTDEGAIKILDFGLAKPMVEGDDATITRTQEGRIVGTPGYMSPEQATGRAIDVRTDVFAMGVMLYEMIAGKRPFTGDTSMDVLMTTSRDPHGALSHHEPRVSRALEAVVDRCLEKRAIDRWEDASALLAALDAPDLARPPSSARRALVLAALGASALGAVALVARTRAPLPTPAEARAITSDVALRAAPSASAMSPTVSTTTPAIASTSLPSSASVSTAPASLPRPTPAARPSPVGTTSALQAPSATAPRAAPGGVIETSPY